MIIRKKCLVRCLFTVYAAAVLAVLFLRRYPTYIGEIYWECVLRHLQLVPFGDLVGVLTAPLFSARLLLENLANLIGNCVLFLPLGIFLPLLWKRCRRGLHTMGIVLFLGAALEAAQMFLLVGIFDTTDILMYLLGTGIGFSIWKAISRRRSAASKP